MGHSHFHAVLIFYAWTAVFAIGTLLFMFVPWGWALAALVIGVVVCSFLTFAPLTRVKRRAPDLLEAGSLDADVPGTGWRGTTIPDAAASDTPVETSR
jgi:UDP-GlcNAc:undecaprenyl-phosphate GlcNAc-1-phosphate transferase